MTKSTLLREKKREKDGKLVQWTGELPCFAHECKEQGSVIFFLAPRTLQVDTQHSVSTAMQHITHTHPEYLYAKQPKKPKQ